MIAGALLVATVLFAFGPNALADMCSQYKGPQPPLTAEAKANLDQAMQLERTDPQRAIALYKKFVDMKNGYAAKRLAEIYKNGIPGTKRDYAETLHWESVAERLGVKIWECARGGPR